MTLLERSLLHAGVESFCFGVLIETRGPRHSLFLKQYHELGDYDHAGETYVLTQGVSGAVVMRKFVARGTGAWKKLA